MYCVKCGSRIPDDSVFCGSCGTKQNEYIQAVENSSPVVNLPSQGDCNAAVSHNMGFFDITYAIGDFVVTFIEAIVELGMFIVGVLLLLGVCDSWI